MGRILLGLFCVSATAWAAPLLPQQPTPQLDPRKLATLPAEELIELLHHIDKPGSGYDSHHARNYTDWHGHSTFAPSQQRLSRLQRRLDREPVSPVVIELVRRGAKSLPALLKHVDDSRPTELMIDLSQSFNYHLYVHCEYDPRDRLGPLPMGVFAPNHFTPDDALKLPDPYIPRYRVRVGDVCFALVGAIVNRHLQAVGINPYGRCAVISSPIDNPALAAAVRADWKNLSEEAHKKSLLVDIRGHYPAWSIDLDALERLLFYYPREGIEEAVQLLRRKVIARYRVTHFVEGTLLAEEDDSRWPEILESFQRDFGTHADEAIAHELRRTMNYYRLQPKENSRDGQTAALSARAEKLLQLLESSHGAGNSAKTYLASCDEQKRVLERVQSYRWPILDAAAQQLFESLVHNPPDDDAVWTLGEACLSRLHGKGRMGSLIKHVEQRLAELKQLPSEQWHDEKEQERLTAWLRIMKR